MLQISSVPIVLSTPPPLIYYEDVGGGSAVWRKEQAWLQVGYVWKTPLWPGGGGVSTTVQSGRIGVLRLDMEVGLIVVKFKFVRLIDWELVALIWWVLITKEKVTILWATSWVTHRYCVNCC